MSEEEEGDTVVPQPGAPIVEFPYPYELLNPRTGAALDIRHFVYGDFFWNIDRVLGKRAVYKRDERLYTFSFTVVWRETWHSRAMIRQLGLGFMNTRRFLILFTSNSDPTLMKTLLHIAN